MTRLKYGFILIGLLLAVLPNVAFAAVAPFCGPGQAPHYQFGFQALSDNLGAAMGQPTECEHANADNGDTLQHTTKGLAFYRYSTNTPTFTTGYEHFALTSIGPVRWTGIKLFYPNQYEQAGHGDAPLMTWPQVFGRAPAYSAYEGRNEWVRPPPAVVIIA